MRRLLLLDVDGVIADCTHRLPLAEQKDYNAFYSAEEILQDKLISGGESLMKSLRDSYYSFDKTDTLFLTGRPERTRNVTEIWLKANDVYPRGPILMRKDGDYRPSGIVKLELLDAYLEEQYLDRNHDEPKRKLNKFKKLPIEEKRREMMEHYDSAFYVDDDPKNIKAICEAYPSITGLTFGVSRFA